MKPTFDNWRLEDGHGATRDRYWRSDGMLVCAADRPEPSTGFGPGPDVPDAPVHWTVRAPRPYPRGPKIIDGTDPADVIARSDVQWPKLDVAPVPRDGMAVWHQDGVYMLAAVICTTTAIYPSLFGTSVWRLALIPFMGLNDRRGARAVASEIAVDEWPHGFLILDPGFRIE
jgi:hypothetical protein